MIRSVSIGKLAGASPSRGTDFFEINNGRCLTMAETKKKKATTGTSKKTVTRSGKKQPAISRKDAEQIAWAYLADKGAFSISGIADGIPEGFEAYFTANKELAAALRGCWVVECGLDPFLVVDGGTMLIGISKTTGDIVYAGILHVA